ncbi:VWA domain-containing protein [Patescibacteria group bacterium]|nr:VWA domain-containing protein [Patescibacteria group bacterium]
MVEIDFIYPYYLLFLLIIPILIFIHFISFNVSKNKAVRFANFEAMAKVKNIDLLSKNVTVLYLSLIIVFSITLALSGIIVYIDSDASSHSFVIAIDASSSMDANDILPNRLEASKDAAKRFLDSLPAHTPVGVVSYSGISFIETDITTSKILAKQTIDEIEISGIGGTDVYEVIITSVNLLKGEDSKAVILFSDGQINVGVLESIISYALDKGVVIHTIGVGTEEGGITGYGVSRLNPEILQALSFNTGGVYLKLDEMDSDNLFSELVTKTRKKVPVNFSVYFMIISLVLFVILFVLINSKYRGLP